MSQTGSRVDAGSQLTRVRPDIWIRAVGMAHDLTGLTFVPKLENPDGSLSLCGGGGFGRSYRPTGKSEVRKDENGKSYRYNYDTDQREYIDDHAGKIAELEREIEKLKKQTLSVAVPEGSVEWILHEVGHWLAATPDERLLPNYGLTQLEWGRNAEAEIAAWAFEDMVLSPFGPTRSFVAPTCQDGLGFRAGPLPGSRHVELEVDRMGVDLAAWRSLAKEWVTWGRSLGHRAPWCNLN